MHVSARSYLIAGVAALSAGAIAVVPVQPLRQDLAPAAQQVESLAVGLAASIDPITPWIDTFQTAADNIVGLFTAWADQPFPIITQIITNQFAYLSILPDIPAIISQVISNISSAIQAPFQADTNTLDPAHLSLYTLLPQVAPTFPQQLLDLLTTSTLGIIGGALGPVLAPVIALVDSVQSIIGALGNSDFLGALNDLINIPANLVNAFLNGGQKLDISGILAPLLPDSVTLNSSDLVLGGILAQGASLFNALGIDVSVRLAPPPFPPVNVAVPGVPGGIFGALIAFTKAIANSIEVVPPGAASTPRIAAAEAPDEVTAADVTADEPVAIEATADVPDAPAPDAVAYSTAPVEDAAPVEVTVATPMPSAGSGPVRRGGQSVGIRAGRGAAQATAATTSDNAPKESGKARAGRG